MTVKYLIERLKKFPGNTQVYMSGIDEDTIVHEEDGSVSAKSLLDTTAVCSVKECFDSEGRFIELTNSRKV